ncbi:unnamed protein product [Didymodactylos carnosus]|uniref:PA14 domain-containing protein n=1 Tax=Didymodactylos carnosus TaxID=1234261 RepID=A0A814EJE7_9BILA|nr:unnamed protein product [Didymodactylos carnosus]CAF3743091.1 unnamed protein product [Didymodactylos carnosus]
MNKEVDGQFRTYFITKRNINRTFFFTAILFLFEILLCYYNSLTTIVNVLPFSPPSPTATGPCVANLSADIGLPPSNFRLYLEWFSNTGFSQETNQTNVVTYCSQLGINGTNAISDPSCQIPNKYLNSTEFSLRWTGVLTVPITGNYTFYCYYPLEYSNLLLWIDDQILCPIDNYTAISLPLSTELSVPVRMEYIHWNKEISATKLVIQVHWKRINDKKNTQSESELIPSCVLNGCTSYPEQRRHFLSDQLLHSGWNTYSLSSMTTHVFMPDGFAVSLSLYNSETRTVWTDFHVENVDSNDNR